MINTRKVSVLGLNLIKGSPNVSLRCTFLGLNLIKGFPCFIEAHSLGFEPHQRLPLFHWGSQSWVWTSSKAPLVSLRCTFLGLNLIKGSPCFIESHTIYFLKLLGGSGTDLSVYFFTINFLLKWIEDHMEDWLKCQISSLVKYCLKQTPLVLLWTSLIPRISMIEGDIVIILDETAVVFFSHQS